jgi:hypothetical protein
MAIFQSHVNLVRANTSLLENTLLPVLNEHPDWVVTVAFYTALHMVEAMFFHDHPKVHTTDHTDRSAALQSDRYQHIWRDYRPLYSNSRIARYLATTTGSHVASYATYTSPKFVRSVFIEGHLAKVKSATEQVIRQHVSEFTFSSPIKG